jgi:hypothetical protein
MMCLWLPKHGIDRHTCIIQVQLNAAHLGMSFGGVEAKNIVVPGLVRQQGA